MLKRKWAFSSGARSVLIVSLALAAGLGGSVIQTDAAKRKKFTDEFRIEDCTFATVGANPYFILDPGYQIVLEGKEGKDLVNVTIKVTNQTKVVDGVLTRVVEEKEMKDGELYEISLNYFAHCEETSSVFYFGEDVDFYKNGQIVNHDGSWLAGQGGAKPGVIMPGSVLLGARYYQEVAPGIARDRAQIVSLDERVETPAGDFTRVLKTRETTPLERDVSIKYYAHEVGMIQDGPLKLKSYGKP